MASWLRSVLKVSVILGEPIYRSKKGEGTQTSCIHVAKTIWMLGIKGLRKTGTVASEDYLLMF